MSEPIDLADALSEVYLLRSALAGAVIGSRIIVRQLDIATDPMLKWACSQARKNMECDQAALDRSREDFPFSWPEDAYPAARYAL